MMHALLCMMIVAFGSIVCPESLLAIQSNNSSSCAQDIQKLEEERIFFTRYILLEGLQCSSDHALMIRDLCMRLDVQLKKIRDAEIVYRTCASDDSVDQQELESLAELMCRQIDLLKLFYHVARALHFDFLMQGALCDVRDNFWSLHDQFIRVIVQVCHDFSDQLWYTDVVESSVEEIYGMYGDMIAEMFQPDKDRTLSLLGWSYQQLCGRAHHGGLHYAVFDQRFQSIYSSYARAVALYYTDYNKDALQNKDAAVDCTAGKIFEDLHHELYRLVDDLERARSKNSVDSAAVDLEHNRLMIIQAMIRQNAYSEVVFSKGLNALFSEGISDIQRTVAARYAALYKDRLSSLNHLDGKVSGLVRKISSVVEQFVVERNPSRDLFLRMMLFRSEVDVLMRERSRHWCMRLLKGQDPACELLSLLNNMLDMSIDFFEKPSQATSQQGIVNYLIEQTMAQGPTVKQMFGMTQGSVALEYAGKIFNNPKLIALALSAFVAPSAMMSLLKYMTKNLSHETSEQLLSFVKTCDIHNCLEPMLTFFSSHPDVVQAIEHHHPALVQTLHNNINLVVDEVKAS